MKNWKSLAMTVALGSLAAILAGCGGGGGGGSDSPPSLQLSGTAAVGAALANAAIQVKCATGAGTATTTSAGGYTVTLTGGALPCIVRVSGTAGSGVAVTLHSLAETGSSANGTTSATANLTPVTEMIVAQVVAGMPGGAFADFHPQQVNQAAVAAAVTTIGNALKAAGVDLAGIDPLKATLVPANGSVAGNAYDRLLDQLGRRLGPASLPMVVNQIATAAATQSGAGLDSAIAAVSGGALAGCPVAVSGRYRTLEYWGRTSVREINFRDMTFQLRTGSTIPITADPDQPCAFTAAGPADGQVTEWSIAFGPAGVGSFRARFTGPVTTPGTVGYIFPEQAHPAAALVGTWTSLQSGSDVLDGLIHWLGQWMVKDEKTVGACDYDPGTWACVDGGLSMALGARDDGGFDFNETGQPGVGRLYAYRSPEGALALFGTTNPDGDPSAAQQTVLVATRLERTALPAQGSVSRFWDTTLLHLGGSTSTLAPTADETTQIQVDASAGTVRRRRTSDAREDVMVCDAPLAGMRTRAAGSWNGQPYLGVYLLPLADMGVTTTFNSDPTGAHFYGVSPRRP